MQLQPTGFTAGSTSGEILQNEAKTTPILYKKTPFFEGKGVDVGLLRQEWTCPSELQYLCLFLRNQ